MYTNFSPLQLQSKFTSNSPHKPILSVTFNLTKLKEVTISQSLPQRFHGVSHKLRSIGPGMRTNLRSGAYSKLGFFTHPQECFLTHPQECFLWDSSRDPRPQAQPAQPTEPHPLGTHTYSKPV